MRFLIDRHSEDERVYDWAAWYFNYQHRYSETDFLVNERNKVEGVWQPFNRALARVRAGNYKNAKAEFKNVIAALETETLPQKANEYLWASYANIGLILEFEHNFKEALQYFSRAAAEIQIRDNSLLAIEDKNSSREKAALLQLKVARCFTALGSKVDAKDAVLKAAEFAPDNINVRIAVSRLKER
jgi:tetratricopeptide (TPR) repeat protein